MTVKASNCCDGTSTVTTPSPILLSTSSPRRLFSSLFRYLFSSPLLSSLLLSLFSSLLRPPFSSLPYSPHYPLQLILFQAHGKYKTTMCRDLLLPQSCPRGASCTFAHTQEEMERYRSQKKNLKHVSESEHSATCTAVTGCQSTG